MAIRTKYNFLTKPEQELLVLVYKNFGFERFLNHNLVKVLGRSAEAMTRIYLYRFADVGLVELTHVTEDDLQDMNYKVVGSKPKNIFKLNESVTGLIEIYKNNEHLLQDLTLTNRQISILDIFCRNTKPISTMGCVKQFISELAKNATEKPSRADVIRVVKKFKTQGIVKQVEGTFSYEITQKGKELFSLILEVDEYLLDNQKQEKEKPIPQVHTQFKTRLMFPLFDNN